MMKSRGIVLSRVLILILAQLALLTSNQASAAGSSETFLTNVGSGLDASVIGALCHENVTCLRGRRIWLETREETWASHEGIFHFDGQYGAYYKIRWFNSNLCAHPTGRGNGSLVVLADCDSPGNQWRVEGFFGTTTGAHVVSKNSGRCLDASNPNFPRPPRPLAFLQIWDCTKAPDDAWDVNQEWTFD